MKVIIWKGNHKYTDDKIQLLPNVIYKIGEDINEEKANSILEDYGPHGLVEIIDENDLTDKSEELEEETKADLTQENDTDEEDNKTDGGSIFEME